MCGYQRNGVLMISFLYYVKEIYKNGVLMISFSLLR